MDSKRTDRAPMVAQPQPAAAVTDPPRRTRKPSSNPTTSKAADAALARIRSHLEKGRYRTAQRLAKEAAGQHPDHRGIATMNRGLNGRVFRTSPASGHSRREEFAWLQNPPRSARGKLVALVGDEMVACAETMTELRSLLEPMKLSKLPLVHRVEE